MGRKSLTKLKEKLKEKEERQMVEAWDQNEIKTIPQKYGCEILLVNASSEQLKDTSFPTDAYKVKYKINDENYIDLCRGTPVKIFDLYYDKFGVDCVQSINWGPGKVNPRLWMSENEKSKSKKKRR